MDLPEEPSDDPDADYNFQSAFMWKKSISTEKYELHQIAEGELDDQSGSDDAYQTLVQTVSEFWFK